MQAELTNKYQEEASDMAARAIAPALAGMSGAEQTQYLKDHGGWSKLITEAIQPLMSNMPEELTKFFSSSELQSVFDIAKIRSLTTFKVSNYLK